MAHSPHLKPEDLLAFIQIYPYPGQFSRLGLTDNDQRTIEIAILAHPKAGTVIQGTNGLRKLRCSLPRKQSGKSGGYRIFYVYFEEYGTVFLWAIIEKGESDDLSDADRTAIGKQVLEARRVLKKGLKR